MTTWLRPALTAVVIVVLFAAAGALGGWVWHQLWDPPFGQAIKHQWYPVRGTTRSDLSTDETSLGQMFDATGLYMCVGFVGGLLLGLVTAVVVRRTELVVLGAVIVGSALAAFVAQRVGLHLSPPDPASVAATADNFTPIDGDMTISGHGAYAFWTFGAVLGLGGVYLVSSSSTHAIAPRPPALPPQVAPGGQPVTYPPGPSAPHQDGTDA